MKDKRRSLIKKLFTSLVAVTGLSTVAKAASGSSEEKEAGNIEYDQEVPLFAGHTRMGKMIYIAGKGDPF